MVRNIDLNSVPDESWQLEISDTSTDLQHVHPSAHSGFGPALSATDANAIDDEVTFLSPAEWRAPRRRRTPRIPVEYLERNTEHSGAAAEERIPILCPDCCHRERAAVEEPIPMICPDCRQQNLIPERATIPFFPEAKIEVSSSSSSSSSSTEPEPEPEPDESGLICPVCMNRVKEPAATNCGHVFCSSCIQEAVARQKKCPACRKRLTKRSFHKIFLPNS